MKPIELLWFEDVNPFNEPVFAFPAVGRLSMRQMLMLGVGTFISWILYQSTSNYTSFSIVILMSYLALKKHKVQSPESQLFSIFLFYIKLNRKKINNRKKSSKLVVAQPYKPKFQKLDNHIPVRQVYSEPLKPIRLKIRLQKPDGTPIPNTEAKVVFDGKVACSLSTDANGELEAIVIPQSLGEKRLEIYARGLDFPVYREIISIWCG